MNDKPLTEKDLADALMEKQAAKKEADYKEAWSRINAEFHSSYGFNLLAECNLNVIADLIKSEHVARMGPSSSAGTTTSGLRQDAISITSSTASRRLPSCAHI